MQSFDEQAPDWDSPERIERAHLIADAIRRAVPLTPTSRVLELGAGTGLLGLALAGDVGELVLADASPGMLAVAETKIAAAGLRHVRTVLLELTVDPLPPERFDVAVSLLALHHVASTAEAMQALSALLEPGGHIAIVDLDAEDGSFHTDPDARVHHGLERQSLAATAEAAGFRDVVFSTAHQIAKNGRDYPLFLLVATRAGAPGSQAPAGAPGSQAPGG